MLRKFPSNKLKMHSLFFRGRQLITVLLLIRDSYMSWSTMFISLKDFVGFSILYLVSFLIRFIFLLNKKHGLFGFKTSTIPLKIKIMKKPHTQRSPDLWFLSYNKKLENSMIYAWVGAPQKLTWRRTF